MQRKENNIQSNTLSMSTVVTGLAVEIEEI